MNLNELLSTNVSTFKSPARLPEGTFEAIILRYGMLPFYWKNSNLHGLSYVPTIKLTRCIDAEDESNPELAEEMQHALAEYGDWKSRELRFAIPANGTDRLQTMAGIAAINFPLVQTDAEGNAIGLLDGKNDRKNMVWRFYLSEKGKQQGFAHDVLGLDYPDGAELGTVIEDTVNKKFILSIGYEPRKNDPEKKDMVIVRGSLAATM
jgi:hypothetical protein